MYKLLNLWILISMVSLNAWAQNKISGKVTSSDDGSELPGVSIKIKGSASGTQTDINGDYTIEVSKGQILVFSFVGMTTTQISIGNQSTLNVTLENDPRALSELVVTGTGSAISKRELAIDVQALSAADLPPVPTASIDQALVGKIAGAQISSTGGMPGQPVNILLRGINTLNRGTNPMIMMDGIQMAVTDLNSIDLNMVDRVEVIQGAAAATMYGAQGANGVIQLFTKRSKLGKLRVDLNSSIINSEYLNIGGLKKSELHGFVTNSKNEVIGSSKRALVLDPFFGSYSENVQFNSTDPRVKIDKPYGTNLKYFDHFKEFFVPATNYNNGITISNGTDKNDFLISYSNNDQTSNFKNFGGLNRSNLTTNIGFQLAKNLSFRSTTQGVYTNTDMLSTPSEVSSGQVPGREIIFTIFNSRPFANYEFKDEDGNYPAYFGDAVGVNGSNPNYWLQYSKREGKTIDILQSFNLNYKVTKFLEFDAKYGINFRNQDNKFTFLNQSENANSDDQKYWIGAFAQNNTGEISNWNVKNTFQNLMTSMYIKTDFKDNFKVDIPLRTTTHIAFDYRNTNYKQYVTYGTSLPTYTPINASQAPNASIWSDYSEPFITFGYLLNQRLDYSDLAGVSAGFRTDYSSAFGAGSKPFTFPRGDGYFRVSSLGLWKNTRIGKIIDEFKLRAAYGAAGIQPRPFDRYVTLNPGTIGGRGVFSIPLNQPNPNLGVEVSKELEIGTDIGFGITGGKWLSNGAISASVWKRSTDNAIFNVDAAPSSGVGTLRENAFSLASSGRQLSLDLTILKSKTFNWNLTVNIGNQTSKITALKGANEIIVTSNAGSTGYTLKVGEKIGQLYGYYAIKSLDELTPAGTPALPAAERSLYEVASNGWVVNKETKAPYFTPDQYSFGDPNPKFNYSIINSLNYRNMVTLGIQIDGVQGSHLYNQTKEWMYRDGIHSDYSVPFTVNGQTGAWAAFYRGVYAERSRNGTKNYFYEDASFVRLRNININISINKILKLNSIRNLELTLAGRNIYTLTKYTGLDPEISSGENNSAWDRGVDNNTMPNLKSYQIGINIGL